MKIKQFIQKLESFFPREYQERFDNTGLLTGDDNKELIKILLTLDTTEKIIDEAIEKEANFVLSFHPIIFQPLKKITGKTYVEKVLLKAIKNDIAIYSIHTVLDNHINGVNKKICDKLNLINTKILIPKKNILKKISVYVPKKYSENLIAALFESGAGSIGNYENCSFNYDGIGTFKGNESSNPFIGNKKEIHHENESCINITFPIHLENLVLETLRNNHPYEEIAYEIVTLDNSYQNYGMGMVGILESHISEELFLEKIKGIFNVKVIKHSNFINKNIKKIGVLGGSGSFAIEDAIKEKCDVFLSADFKYHDFFKADNKILLADIGHWESEQFTNEILFSKIKEIFPNLAVCFSSINTNPINYF